MPVLLQRAIENICAENKSLLEKFLDEVAGRQFLQTSPRYDLHLQAQSSRRCSGFSACRNCQNVNNAYRVSATDTTRRLQIPWARRNIAQRSSSLFVVSLAPVFRSTIRARVMRHDRYHQDQLRRKSQIGKSKPPNC
jgi:hypothetical protein